MSSRHNKYVSVTDWFALPPSSKGTTTTSLATGIATSGANFAGGSWGQGGSGGGLTIQIIKTNDTTPASNSNVYSALRVHDSYISKDKDERTSGKLSSDVGFEVGEFVSGASGAICYIDPETLQTTAELDRLKVRIKAYFETLEIVNVNSVGGKQIISPAGAITCAKVEVKGPITETIHVTDDEGNPLYDEDGNPITETIIVSEDNGIPEDTYRCYFLAELDGDKVENRFHEGDQAYCQTFNAFTGEQSKVSNTYYWRLVTGVTVNPIEKDGKQWHYIDLSISDCDTDSDVPKEGDVICHRGSRTDNDRRNLLEFSAVDTFSPSITLYQGVGISDPSNNQYPYSLTGKDVISYGVNKTTNRAFMNVYGDMYVGDRDGKSFIRFDEVSGLTIKGNLSAGTTLEGSDLTLEQRINAAADAYKEDVDLFKNEILKGFGEIQDQIDGAIETYFLDPVPTLDNEPAVNWTTDEEKANHVGDLYYSAEGKAYRFQYNEIKNEDGSKTYQYYWNVITDTDIALALANAAKAQDTADSKRKIFVQRPKTNDSYQEGDMWANASYVDPATERLVYDGDLLRAIVDKQAGYPFSIDHWILASKYTDDTAAIAAQQAAEKAQTAADNAQADATAAANRLNAWAEDGVISPTEKQGIKEEYARVLADRDHIDNEYEKYFLGTPTDYNNAYLPYITALIGLFTSELEIVPIPNNFETLQTAYYTARTNALNVISSAAKKVADDAQSAADNAREEAEKALTSAEEAKEVVYDMNLAVTGSAEYVREAFADGIINKGERATIENYVHQIDTVSAQVEESYKEVVSNQLLVGSNELENLKTSYATFVNATAELKNSISDISKMESVANINKATFENKYNNFNAAYSTYTQWLNAASKYVEYALNSRVDSTIEALGGYSYLKSALNNEKTTVTGGLVLTTMLALGYTDTNQEYHINAGINGSAAKNNDIVIWAGGSNIDVFAEPNNPQAADFLVRGDGTGYAAGGNFWWDSNGIIHADPMSFVISEQSVGMLLASFQVYYDVNPATGKTEPYAIDPKVPFTTLNVASDLVLSDSAVLHFGDAELGYDTTNNAVYLRSKDGSPINFYTTGGISMYGLGNTSVTTIMDAILYDDNTLGINSNGELYVKGGTGGGGVADSVAWANITGKPTFATVATSGKYSDLSGTPSSLPASDVYSWAKSATKPTYTWSEITSKPTWIGSSKPSYSYSEITGAISTTELQNYLTQNSYLNVTSGDNRYLKLSGGTITGTLEIKCGADNKIVINNTDGEGYSRIVFQENGSYIGQLLSTKDGNIHWGESKIWHSGNFKPSNYLPLSGGILSRGSGAPLIINVSDASDTGILFTISDTPKSWVGYDTTHGAYLYNNTSKTFLSIKDDGSIFYSKDTIWHSGNDGSGSGLDADMLDGYHVTHFMSYIKGSGYVQANLLNSELWNVAGGNGYIEYYDNGTWFNSRWGRVSAHYGFDGDLRGNASSATKLQTARTIWGQSFDGTGNVSGDISDLSTIIFDTSGGASNIGYLWTNTRGMHMDMSGLGTEHQGTNLTLTSSGNVGIGTPSPAYKLDIYGVIQSTASKSNSLCFECNSSGDTSGRGGEINRYNGVLYLQYDTAYNAVICYGGGNVGIGMTSPSYKLDVNGGARFGSLTPADGLGVIPFAVANSSYANTGWCASFGTEKGGVLLGYQNSKGIAIIGASKTENICICPDGGNVGIGTANPLYKYHVVGDSYIQGVSYVANYISFDYKDHSINNEGAGRLGTFDRRGGMVLQFGTNTSYRRFSIIDQQWTLELFSVDDSGNVFANGGITMYSDQRKKTILNHVELSLKQIADAPLIEHYYNSDEKKTTHVGSIAQYWASMNDWFCKLDSEGYYTMEIQNAALASAISVARELVKFENETDKRIRLLEEENKELRNEIERLKSV